MPTSNFGEVVSWEAPKEVEVSKFKTVMGFHGLEDYVSELRPTTAFNRAASTFTKGRVIRPLKPTKGLKRVQFTAESPNGDGFLHYEKETSVHFDKHSNTIECPDKPELTPSLEEEFNKKLLVYQASDISNALERAITDGSDLFRLKNRSNFFLIPPGNTPRIDKITAVLDEIDGKMIRLIVPETPTGARLVKDVIAEGMDDTIGSLIEAIDNFDTSTRGATLKSTAERITALQLKSEGYSELLEEAKLKLDTKLAIAKARLRSKIEIMAAIEV